MPGNIKVRRLCFFSTPLATPLIKGINRLLLLAVILLLGACSGMNKSVAKVKNLLPDLSFKTSESPAAARENLLEDIEPLKQASFVFLPVVSFVDLKSENLRKNNFILTKEIYSETPEEPVDSLSKEDCFSPNQQNSISTLERLLPVFLRNLGLDSKTATEIAPDDQAKVYYLIQPVLLKYQYCDEALVEIQYFINRNNGDQTSETIKTTYEAEDFEFPEVDPHQPFLSHQSPETQFPALRYALTAAVYTNTLNLVELISKKLKDDGIE